MRFERTYRDFAVRLDEFRHDLYPGTQVPKNFSSEVTLLEPGGTQRPALIRMNEPLRYGGETWFQMNWIRPGPAGGDDRGTVLQVVSNPGWTVPYIAVTVGGLGLLIHFVLRLWSYLKRDRTERGRARSEAGRGRRRRNPVAPPNWPALVTHRGGAAAWCTRIGSEGSGTSGCSSRQHPVLRGSLLQSRSKRSRRILMPHSSATKRCPLSPSLPVSSGGRIKPWDSVARDTLTSLSGRSPVETADGDKQDAAAWAGSTCSPAAGAGTPPRSSVLTTPAARR